MEKIGINHPVVKLSAYTKMSVTIKEREMIIRYRKEMNGYETN